MSDAAKAATKIAAGMSDALGIDQHMGGAQVVVRGRLAESRDGTVLEEGDFEGTPWANCQLEYMGGKIKVKIQSGSETHRRLSQGDVTPGTIAEFAIKVEQQSVNTGKYSRDVFNPEGRGRLLLLEKS